MLLLDHYGSKTYTDWQVLTRGTFGTRPASRVFVSSMANNHHRANHHGCSLHSAGLDKSEEMEQSIVRNSSDTDEIPPTSSCCKTRSHAQKTASPEKKLNK
jgi:hypothetical protein